MDSKYLYEEWNFDTYKEQMGFIVRTGDTRESILQDYIIRPFLQSVLTPELDVVPVDVKLSGERHDYGKYCGRNLRFKEQSWSEILKICNKDEDSSEMVDKDRGEEENKREVIRDVIDIKGTEYQWETGYWNGRGRHNKEERFGYYPNDKMEFVTPDLCIVRDWKWNNFDKEKEDYKAVVEVKSTANKGSDSLGSIVRDEDEEQGRLDELCKSISERIPIYKKKLSLLDELCIHFRGNDRVITTDGLTWLLLKKDGEKVGCKCYVVGRYFPVTKEKGAEIEFYDEVIFDELKRFIKEYVNI